MRKSPIRHLVRFHHTRKGTPVQAYYRGDTAVVRANAGKGLANPTLLFPKNISKDQEINKQADYLRKLFVSYLDPPDVEIESNKIIVNVDTESFKKILKNAGFKVSKVYIGDDQDSYIAKKKGFTPIECSQIIDTLGD